MSQVYKKGSYFAHFVHLKPTLFWHMFPSQKQWFWPAHTMISCDEMEQNAQSTFPKGRNKSDPRIRADSTDAIRVGLCDLN